MDGTEGRFSEAAVRLGRGVLGDVAREVYVGGAAIVKGGSEF